jgi:hypothetical protein
MTLIARTLQVRRATTRATVDPGDQLVPTTQRYDAPCTYAPNGGQTGCQVMPTCVTRD